MNMLCILIFRLRFNWLFDHFLIHGQQELLLVLAEHVVNLAELRVEVQLLDLLKVSIDVHR